MNVLTKFLKHPARVLTNKVHKPKKMKTLILAVIIITGMASCTVSQPGEYYPQQRVYSNSYDPYNNPVYSNRYETRRVYDYNSGRYYDVPVYGTPVYRDRAYRRENNYRRDDYRREYRRENNERRESYRYPQRNTEQRVEQPREKRLPDGTRISPDGTITLPNGEVRRKQ